MILTMDVGNTTIQGGLFEDNDNILVFRKSTAQSLSSDEIGLFLRDVINLNGFDYKKIEKIACCSVVPSLNHAIEMLASYDVKDKQFLQQKQVNRRKQYDLQDEYAFYKQKQRLYDV